MSKLPCDIPFTKTTLGDVKLSLRGKLTCILGVASLSIIPSGVLASGYQLLEHSASGLGRAFSGEAVIGDSAAILAANAAGMALLDRRQLSTSLTYIDVDGQLSGIDSQLSSIDLTNGATTALGPVSGTTKSSFGEAAVVPAFFYVSPLSDKVSYGLGIFSDFGLSTSYDDDFAGRLLALRSEVISVNINPSISYRINDNLSVGLGISYVYIEGELSSATFGGGISDNVPLPVPENQLTLTGSDTGWGANVGLLYEITESTRLGFGYRSKVEVELEGDGEFDNCETVPLCRVDAKLPIDLPEIVSLNAYHEFNPAWAIHGGVTYTRWSRFDELLVDFPDGTLPDSVTPEEWDDSLRTSIGLTYRYSDQWTFRTGYSYDNSPVPNTTRTLRIPDNDRQWLSIGASYHMRNMSWDVGYSYLWSDVTSIDETRAVSVIETTAFQNRLTGQTDTDAHVLGVQFNYLF